MEWKEIAQWLWGLFIPAGWWMWNRQDKRLEDIEDAMKAKADKDEVNKALEDRRQDARELFKANADLRADMMGGFSQLKDLIHSGQTEILRELGKKADK